VNVPTPAHALAVAAQVTGRRALAATRFPTGLDHFVYEVRFADGGPPIVARLASAERAFCFRGAVHWYPMLRDCGVPLPELLYAELDERAHGFAVMLLERLPGIDLNDVYPSLTREQRCDLANEIATFQCRVQALLPGPGFGYATSYEDPSLHASWLDLMRVDVARTRSRITDERLVSQALVDRIAAIVEQHAAYFTAVRPLPFLDDTTTKNVIMHDGRMTGVVDADFLCFGDIAQLVGLVQTALISSGYETDYVEFLADALGLDAAQREAVSVYTLIFSAGFLAEVGHSFNREQPIAPDPDHVARLTGTIERLLHQLERGA